MHCDTPKFIAMTVGNMNRWDGPRCGDIACLRDQSPKIIIANIIRENAILLLHISDF
jgi:hypothetical protein